MVMGSSILKLLYSGLRIMATLPNVSGIQMVESLAELCTLEKHYRQVIAVLTLGDREIYKTKKPRG
jgi:hypothetical protein